MESYLKSGITQISLCIGRTRRMKNGGKDASEETMPRTAICYGALIYKSIFSLQGLCLGFNVRDGGKRKFIIPSS